MSGKTALTLLMSLEVGNEMSSDETSIKQPAKYDGSQAMHWKIIPKREEQSEWASNILLRVSVSCARWWKSEHLEGQPEDIATNAGFTGIWACVFSGWSTNARKLLEIDNESMRMYQKKRMRICSNDPGKTKQERWEGYYYCVWLLRMSVC